MEVMLIFIIVGMVVMIIGVVLFIKEKNFLKNCSSTIGTVIGISKRISRSSNGRRTYYHPIIQFQTFNSTEELKSSVGTNPCSYKVGDQVEILYAADNPKKAQLNKFIYKWCASLVLGIIGFVFIAFACTFFLLRK
jgi:hypothetical protein